MAVCGLAHRIKRKVTETNGADGRSVATRHKILLKKSYKQRTYIIHINFYTRVSSEVCLVCQSEDKQTFGPYSVIGRVLNWPVTFFHRYCSRLRTTRAEVNGKVRRHSNGIFFLLILRAKATRTHTNLTNSSTVGIESGHCSYFRHFLCVCRSRYGITLSFHYCCYFYFHLPFWQFAFCSGPKIHWKWNIREMY